MPSCNTYHFTWVSLTFGVGYLFTAALAKQSLLLTLDEGYLLTATLPDLQHGMAPLGPPAPAQPLLFGLLLLASTPGLRYRPWPPSRGGSSGLLPLASGVRWLLSVSNGLKCRVASLGCRP